MRILMTLLGFGSLFLFSCQKEVHFPNDNGNGSNGNTSQVALLVKTVEVDTADTLTTTYTYNANRKITVIAESGNSHGNPLNVQYHFHRNAAGIITDYSVIDADLVASGIDSITTIVHYASQRYTGFVLNANVAGFILSDSTVFVYDGSGKIVGENAYQSPTGTGTGYYLTGKIDFTYSPGGNLSGEVIHDFNQAGTEIFTATTSNIIYDSKVNPFHTGNEAFVIGEETWISPNNIVSEQLSDSTGPSDNDNVTFTYVYNTDNQPATSMDSDVLNREAGKISYYYQ